MKRTLLILELLFLTVLTLCVASLAGEAVSKPNGKVDLFGGRVDGNKSGNISGSYALPLSSYFGAQLDGLYGKLDGEHLYGGGGHLFWRNSNYALLGLTASYATWNKTDLWRIGVEGEIYWNQFTLVGQTGNQSGDLGDNGYGNVDVRYYLADDHLMLTAGGGSFDDQTIFSTEVEYLTGLGGLSLFATGAMGSDNYDYALGGIRYYFGPEKSLLRRHREDDPFNYIFSSISASIAPSRTPSLFFNPGRTSGSRGERDATRE